MFYARVSRSHFCERVQNQVLTIIGSIVLANTGRVENREMADKFSDSHDFLIIKKKKKKKKKCACMFGGMTSTFMRY